MAKGSSSRTCVLLPVGTLRSQRLSFPLSFITLTTYLPSGEMAAPVALPELVTCVTSKL